MSAPSTCVPLYTMLYLLFRLLCKVSFMPVTSSTFWCVRIMFLWISSEIPARAFLHLSDLGRQHFPVCVMNINFYNSLCKREDLFEIYYLMIHIKLEIGLRRLPVFSHCTWEQVKAIHILSGFRGGWKQLSFWSQNLKKNKKTVVVCCFCVVIISVW